MKTVYIVRHAKSSWDFPELHDDQRPLLEKGKKRTRKVLESILEKQTPTPDLIMSSHAVRAIETARLFAHALHYPLNQIQISKQIYHGGAEQLFDQFYCLDDSYKTVMIFGHNPTLTTFANYFGSKPIDWIPTSGVVCVRLETEKWTEMNLCPNRIVFSLAPKNL